MKKWINAFLAIVGLGWIASTLAAGALPNGPYLIASGKATVDVAPDYAVITFEIDGFAPTTAAASAAANDKADKIFATLKANGIAEDDIRASTLNVSPSYDYEGDKRVYKGQDVSRNFRVTLHDLKKFSDLIQGLLDDNLDDLGSVDFGSTEANDIEKRNLDAAIDDARKQANDMAARVGEHVGRVYGIAPGEYSSFITQEFPYEGRYGTEQLGKIKVTGTRIKRTEGYIIPKSITFSTNVTIVCTVK